MKALTLTQPWATLVAIGAKHVETRSWSTNHRGPLVIHAAKGLAGLGRGRGRGATDNDLWRLLSQQPFETALRVEYGTAERAFNAVSYRRGSIVAVADLVDVLPTSDPATRRRRALVAKLEREIADRDRALRTVRFHTRAIEKKAASFGVDRILEPRLSEIEIHALDARLVAERFLPSTIGEDA